MSQMYILEPPTLGKVVIRTNYGDIDVELWPKEAPRAVRNFVQLCMEGYYTGCLMHRVVKDFIVQTGDPTNTGNGGESVYGAPFADEFHQRLRFSHRGLVAMANEGPNTNRSQFFFTLDRTDNLDRKNTIFGKITGDTIFTLLRIAGVETDANERPVFPIKITSTEILYNPIEDIVPRDLRPQIEAAKEAAAKASAPQVRARAIKNKSLLSFDDDPDADEPELPLAKKVRSMHEAVTDDPRLSSTPAVVIKPSSEQGKETPKETPAVEKAPSNPEPPRGIYTGSSDEELSDSEDEAPAKKAPAVAPKKTSAVPSPSPASSAAAPVDERSAVQREIEALRNKVLQYKRQPVKETEDVRVAEAILSPLEEQRQRYAAQKRKSRDSKSEDATLKALNMFKSKLSNVKETGGEDEEKGEACSRHQVVNCASCRDTFGEKDTRTDSGWIAHSLTFKKSVPEIGTKKDDQDDLLVLDPRVKQNRELLKTIDERRRKAEIERDRLFARARQDESRG